jgi:hypothetical protein
MRVSLLAAVFLLSTPLAGLADENPAAAVDPASLIGKKLDAARIDEIGAHARQTKSGDWSYGLEMDEELVRAALGAERAGGGATLTVSFVYNKRCERGKAAVFRFDAGERFKLKGATGKRYAEAWIDFADKDVFDAQAAKQKMDFGEGDALLQVKLDPAAMAKRGQLALCPSATPPSGAGGHCAIFSLKGFARAYDFVCDAK